MTFEEDRFLRNQLEWVRKRIDLLEQIEYRLKELREWVMYAIDKNLIEQERSEVQVQVTDVQEKIHLLQFEMEWADARRGPHSIKTEFDKRNPQVEALKQMVQPDIINNDLIPLKSKLMNVVQIELGKGNFDPEEYAVAKKSFYYRHTNFA